MEPEVTPVKTLSIVRQAIDPQDIHAAVLTITREQSRVAATSTIDHGGTRAKNRLVIQLIAIHIQAVHQAANVLPTHTIRLRAYRKATKDVSAITILATLSLSSEATNIFLSFFFFQRTTHPAFCSENKM